MKKTYKILPFSIYDISGIEAWLEEQANNGLFPVSLGAWASFTSTGVPGTRFRLIVQQKREDRPSAEQLSLCEQAGWTYAFSVAGIYFLFYATDPAAVEFYTDWESRGFTLEPLERQIAACRRRQCIIYAIFIATVIWALFLFFYQSKFDVQPDHITRLTLLLLNLFQPPVLLFFTYTIWTWRQNRRDAQLLHSIHQALMQGITPPSSNGPSKTIMRDQIIKTALLPLLMLTSIISCFDALNPWSNIPIERFSEPYISIQTIESEAVLPWEEIFGDQSPARPDENHAERMFSLLAPTWYSVTQNCYSPQGGTEENHFSPKPENGIERYAPQLDATYFGLLFPALSRPVAEAQLDAYRLVNLEWRYTDLPSPTLDFAIYATEFNGIWQMLAIGKGSRVAVFRYAGKESLSDHLQELSEAVN